MAALSLDRGGHCEHILPLFFNLPCAKPPPISSRCWSPPLRFMRRKPQHRRLTLRPRLLPPPPPLLPQPPARIPAPRLPHPPPAPRLPPAPAARPLRLPPLPPPSWPRRLRRSVASSRASLGSGTRPRPLPHLAHQHRQPQPLR